MKKLTKSKITKLLKKIVPFLVTIIPSIFIVIKTVFNFTYEIQCKSFYGINLECFKLDSNYVKQVITVVAVICLILGSLFVFSKLINKNRFVFVIVYSLINGTILLIFNLSMFVSILNYNMDEIVSKILEYFNTHAILTIILYFLLSYGLSLALSLFVLVLNNKMK